MKEKFMEGFLVFAEKLQTQRHISAIKDGFTSLMPIIIVGSFCSLFSNIICNTSPGYISVANLPGMGFLGRLKPMFDAANYGTMSMLAIGACIMISMALAEQLLGKSDCLVPVTAIGCYISLVQTMAITTSASGETVSINNVLPNAATNAQGLFVGMIAALVSTEIYCRLIKSGRLEIHMPESVPSNVAKSFSALFPCCLTIFIVSGFGLLFKEITGMTVPQAIIRFIQAPLSGIMTSTGGYIVLVIMIELLWFFGIHGVQTLTGIFEPVLLAAFAENELAYAAGQAIPNIINKPFLNNFTSVTGSGLTGGLIIAIFLFSKRDDHRTIAKLALPCGLFNINEPLIFGLPIVMNPFFGIPLILAPVASNLFAIFMTNIGFCGRMVVNPPWTTPLGLEAFLSSGGNIGAAVTQLLCVLLAAVIYTPFVLMANRQVDEECQETS